jgi:hypothetical protein
LGEDCRILGLRVRGPRERWEEEGRKREREMGRWVFRERRGKKILKFRERREKFSVYITQMLVTMRLLKCPLLK